MRRGELYWANLSPRSGSEQQGSRPVLVVSNDGFNQVPTWLSIIVVPLSTSTTQGTRGPTVVLIPRGEGGVAADSFALCHQVTTLDRRKLTSRLGELSNVRMAEVELGLKAALDLT